jgi:hypothetical protein
MAHVINDRVKETTTTTGTGAVSLGGAVTGFETFAAGIGNSNTTYYAIAHQTESEFEVGLGTLDGDSSDLTRTTVISSSNSDNAVDFAAGTKDVFCTIPASKLVFEDVNNDATVGRNLTVTGDLTVSGDDITMGTNTAGNVLVADGTNFNSIAVGDLSAISTVAADDVLLAVDTSGGGLKKIARSALVSGLAAGTMSELVDDTSPQLGGNLDTNSANILIDDAHFIADESGNEQIIFQTTGSAVNQFDVTNAASGSGPQLSATGSDSNIDLNILAKGTGHVTVVGNSTSGTIQFNCESNSHGQIIRAQPHSASATNIMLLPEGADSTLVSLVSTDTLTNKTLTSPVINTGTFGTSILPTSADGTTLGSASKEFSDLFLADAGTIQFGDDQDVTLTHVADTGLLLNTTMVVQFRDSAINIGSPDDGDLDINADDEIELNSTLIDINGNVEISGTAVTTGVHTFTAVPVFPNNTVETADIQADAVDGTKIADDAINSEHYTDGSIDTAHIAADQITNAKIADDQIDSEHYVDGSIDTAHIADNQITLAKLAGGTDGNIISYDASGDPVAIATGNDGQVLTSTGAGSPPAFEDAAGGGPFTEVNANKFTYTTATNPVLQVIDSTNTVKAQIQGGNTSAIFGSASAHPVTFIQGSGETTVGTIDTTGAWTFPLQPAFSVTTNATQENLTEDADNTIVFGLEIFDTNGDFASNTFTAPVAGKYMITAKMVVAEIDHDGAYYAAFQIVSSNRDYSVNYSVRNFLQSQPELWTFQVAAVVDMDASDTAFVRYRESGPGASQTDVYNANSSGAQEQHQFTGYLLG